MRATEDRTGALPAETEMARAAADVDAARVHAQHEAGDKKLSKAEIDAIEEDALRRRYSTPQKEATSRPPVSANQPPAPTFDEVMHDLLFPASKGDLVMRARNRGLMIEERYQIERLEDRLFIDMEQVKAAMRATAL